jgi:hypothetical protein
MKDENYYSQKLFGRDFDQLIENQRNTIERNWGHIDEYVTDIMEIRFKRDLREQPLEDVVQKYGVVRLRF